MYRFRSEFSFGSAIGTLDEVASAIKECGYTHAPLTDTTAYGWPDWAEACDRQGLVPLYGMTIAVSPEPQAKRPVADFWTFLPSEGDIEAISELVYLAGLQFRYQPLLTYDQAMAAEGVIKIMGEQPLLNHVDPGLDIYLPISEATPHALQTLWTGKTLPAINNRYPRPADRDLWLAAMRQPFTQSYPQHIHSLPSGECEDASLLRDLPSVRLRRGRLRSPGGSLRDKCAASLKEKEAPEVYWDRLEHELGVIEGKKFEDYFLILHQIMSWARENVMCGPARGSAGGSLVCYLLGITSIDPIEHDLMFERFLDENRPDLPDVDIDIADDERAKVIEYIDEIYGRDNVAKLGAIGRYQNRSAIVAALKSMGLEPWEEKAKEISDVKSEEVAGLARSIVGRASYRGTHAAGIVVTDRPVRSYLPVDGRDRTVHCDLHGAEKLGLLKIDLLGLTQLSIHRDALSLASLPLNTLETIPLSDQKAFDVINNGAFSGIFQWGEAVQGLSRKVRITEFENIVALIALARPGPLKSGMAEKWVQGERTGLFIYQEEVMSLCREIGMEWPQVQTLRKAIGKKLPEVLAPLKDEFVRLYAVHKTCTTLDAEDVWARLEEYAGYAFNRSHSVAYAVLAYQAAWLKAHYPAAFGCAVLRHTTDKQSQIKILRELVQYEGMEYVAFDPELSDRVWQIHGNKIVGPLTMLRGIGNKTAEEIISARRRGDPISDRASKILDKAKSEINKLWEVSEALEKAGGALAFEISGDVQSAEKVEPDQTWQKVICIGKVEELLERDENDESRLKSRNGVRYDKGPYTKFVDFLLTDDTGYLKARIRPNQLERLKEKLPKDDRTVVAISGTLCPDFRMLLVKELKPLFKLES
jgi:DNA polymerase III alpha subunit